MKPATLVIFLLSLLCSCASKENSISTTDGIDTLKTAAEHVELPKLYVNYFRDTLYQGMSEWEVDSMTVVSTEYFRIPLLKEKIGFLAMSDSSQPLTDKRSVRFLTYVAGYPTNSEPVVFNSTEEFLNYMSERGYEESFQSKGDEGIIYSFKKMQRK